MATNHQSPDKNPINQQHYSKLRQLAQEGNQDAIAQIFDRTLAHKKITTIVNINEEQLKIILHSQQIPDQWTIKILVDRELSRLQLPLIQKILIESYQPENETPAWIEEFTIGSQIQAANKHWQLKFKPHHHKNNFPIKSITKAGKNSLLIGFILAIILVIFPILKLLFYGFLIIVHEIGHTITNWLFGRPAIPAVDLRYGGGVTLVLQQSNLILSLIYLGFAFLLYRSYPYRKLFNVIIGLILIYTCFLLTRFNEMLSIFMGHGMELIAIVICLYFTMGGYFCRWDMERPIYAMLGFFTLFNDVNFAWNLIFNSQLRDIYLEGKGGIIDNDFSILANNFSLNFSIISGCFLFAIILTPVIAFFLFRYEKAWISAILGLIYND